MNFTEDDIDQYCRGELPYEQAQLLEEAMKQDQQLVREVHLRLAVIKGLQKNNREELKKILKGYQQELKEKKTPLLHFVLRMAAVVVPLALAFTWYYHSTKELDYFGEYYTYYPNYEIAFTRGDSDTTSRAKAFMEYSRKNFDTAIIEFTNNLQHDSLDYASQFYRGLAYIEQQNLKAGLIDLEKVTHSPSRYANTARWYAALTALKINDTEQAIYYFTKLSEEATIYQEKSLRILNKLKQP